MTLAPKRPGARLRPRRARGRPAWSWASRGLTLRSTRVWTSGRCRGLQARFSPLLEQNRGRRCGGCGAWAREVDPDRIEASWALVRIWLKGKEAGRRSRGSSGPRFALEQDDGGGLARLRRGPVHGMAGEADPQRWRSGTTRSGRRRDHGRCWQFLTTSGLLVGGSASEVHASGAPGGSLVRVPEDREGEIMRGRRPQRGKRKREGARGREEICSGELAYRGGGDQALDRGRGTPRSREREEREAVCWLVGHGRRGRSGAAGRWMDASGGSQGGRGVAAGRRIGWDSPPRI